MLLSKPSVSSKLLLLHGFSALNFFLNLGNGCFLFFFFFSVLGLYLLKLLKTMLGWDGPYLACLLQNDLTNKKDFWWLKILSFFANLSNPGSFYLIIYRKFMYFNVTLNIAVFDHFIWKSFVIITNSNNTPAVEWHLHVKVV